MELKGKARIDFEKWFINTYYKKSRKPIQNLQRLVFDSLPNNQKYGVYVDWFDSVGVVVTIEFMDNSRITGYEYAIHTQNDRDYNGEDCMDMAKIIYSDYIKNRPEARTKAIEKAVEIYNNK